MNIGAKIKMVRERRNKTLLQVANALGVTEATVQRYESGNIKNLKLDTITKIAGYLNVDPAFLMGWKDNEENLRLSYEYPYFPISISAGLPFTVDSIMEDQLEKISLPDAIMGKWAGSKDIYVTRVNGDSMNNVVSHNSLIAVRHTELSNLNDGDIVVYSDSGDFSVKRFYNDPSRGRVIFRPDSNDRSFTDHAISYESADSLKIHGKVVLYIVELD